MSRDQTLYQIWLKSNCYLGSFVTVNSSCECGKDCHIRISKAKSVIWKTEASLEEQTQQLGNRTVSLWDSQWGLYESLVTSTMLSARYCGLSLSQKRKMLEAEHHKFQRQILGISWKDKMSKSWKRQHSKNWNLLSRKEDWNGWSTWIGLQWTRHMVNSSLFIFRGQCLCSL